MTPEDEHLVRVAIAADVFRMGEAIYWRRRARQFDWAKPALEEHHGDRTSVELSAAWNRCHQSAEACRSRALFAEMQMGLPDGQELFEVEHLREVA